MTHDDPQPSPLAALILLDLRHSARRDDYDLLVLIARMMALALSRPKEAVRTLSEVANNLRKTE